MFYISKLISKNYLSSYSYHFVKTFFEPNTFVYMLYVYIVKTKYQIAESKAVVGVDQALKALSIYKSLIREKLFKFS